MWRPDPRIEAPPRYDERLKRARAQKEAIRAVAEEDEPEEDELAVAEYEDVLAVAEDEDELVDPQDAAAIDCGAESESPTDEGVYFQNDDGEWFTIDGQPVPKPKRRIRLRKFIKLLRRRR